MGIIASKRSLLIAALIAAAAAGAFLAPRTLTWSVPLVPYDTVAQLVDEEKYPEAVLYCKKRLLSDPKDADTALLLGNIYEIQGKNARALKLYERVARQYPEEGIALYHRARGLYLTGRADKALGEVRSAEALFEKDPDERVRAEGLKGLYDFEAEVLEGQESYKAAAAALEKRLSLDPSDERTRYRLGVAYAYAGQWQHAYKQFNQIVTDHPGTEMARFAENAIQYVRQRKNPDRSDLPIL